MTEENRMVDYVFHKIRFKTNVLRVNQSQIVLDMPFSHVMPETLHLAITDLAAFSGSYTKNPVHFQCRDLKKLTD